MTVTPSTRAGVEYWTPAATWGNDGSGPANRVNEVVLTDAEQSEINTLIELLYSTGTGQAIIDRQIATNGALRITSTRAGDPALSAEGPTSGVEFIALHLPTIRTLHYFNTQGVLVREQPALTLIHEVIHNSEEVKDPTGTGPDDAVTEADMNGANFDYRGGVLFLQNAVARELGYAENIQASYDANVLSSEAEFAEFEVGKSYSFGSYVDVVRIGGLSGNDIMDHTLRTEASSDLFFGLGGDDILKGGAGNDFLYGGAQNDQLFGGVGNDYLDGGLGDDILEDSEGENILIGGDGNDRLTSSSLSVLKGGIGDDHISVGAARSTIEGGSGNDVIDASRVPENSTIPHSEQGVRFIFRPGDGHDVLVSRAPPPVVKQWDYDDYMYAWNGVTELRLEGLKKADVELVIGGDFSGAPYDSPDHGQQVVRVDVVVRLKATGDTVYLGTTQAYFDWWPPTGLWSEGTQPRLTFVGSEKYLETIIVCDDGIFQMDQSKSFWMNGPRNASVGGEVKVEASLDAYRTALNPGDTTLNGGAGEDALYGGLGNDTLTGAGGNDYLEGGAGDDVLIGGAGKDTLRGGEGNDLYIYDRGDGSDIILDGGGVDIVRLKAGIDPTQVTVSQAGQGNDLVLTFADGARLTLDQTVQGANQIEEVIFENGVVWRHEQLLSFARAPRATGDSYWGDDAANTIDAGGGDDTVEGRGGPDRLIGGAGYDMLFGQSGDDDLIGGADGDYLVGGQGNDRLWGSAGSDDYLFSRGGGQDVIYEDFEPGFDTIFFDYGIQPGDVEILRGSDGVDIILRLVGTNDQITIDYSVGDSQYRVEEVVFDDGTVWTAADLNARASVMASQGGTASASQGYDLVEGNFGLWEPPTLATDPLSGWA